MDTSALGTDVLIRAEAYRNASDDGWQMLYIFRHYDGASYVDYPFEYDVDDDDFDPYGQYDAAKADFLAAI